MKVSVTIISVLFIAAIAILVILGKASPDTAIAIILSAGIIFFFVFRRIIRKEKDQ
jgi:hypothetical protein